MAGSSGGALRDCELALAAHWSQLGRLPGGELHEEDGLVWFETPVRRLPYNGVPSTRLAGSAAADAAIERVTGRFRARGVEFWWVDHPSASPRDLGDRLASAGLRAIEQMHFMSMELGGYAPPPPPPGVTFERAEGEAGFRDYLDLTLLYWEVPEDQAYSVATLHCDITPDRYPGQRYLARIDGKAIGKAYLSFPGPPGVASLYGMSVRTEARGRGVAGGLTGVMMRDAAARGCHRAVLHATDMAVGVYTWAGFEECATATVYATAELWSKPAG